MVVTNDGADRGERRVARGLRGQLLLGLVPMATRGRGASWPAAPPDGARRRAGDAQGGRRGRHHLGALVGRQLARAHCRKAASAPVGIGGNRGGPPIGRQQLGGGDPGQRQQPQQLRPVAGQARLEPAHGALLILFDPIERGDADAELAALRGRHGPRPARAPALEVSLATIAAAFASCPLGTPS